MRGVVIEKVDGIAVKNILGHVTACQDVADIIKGWQHSKELYCHVDEGENPERCRWTMFSNMYGYAVVDFHRSGEITIEYKYVEYEPIVYSRKLTPHTVGLINKEFHKAAGIFLSHYTPYRYTGRLVGVYPHHESMGIEECLLKMQQASFRIMASVRKHIKNN